MRERIVIELLLRADQPIHHGDGNDGNTVPIRRRRFQSPDGTFVEVPYVSGVSMAHHLRAAGSWALLEATRMLDDPQLTEAAQRLLFNGGVVAGSSKAVSIAEGRELLELLPHIGLLGGCVSNTIRAGSAKVNDARLVCEETAPFLPEWVSAWLTEHGRRLASECEHVEIVQGMKKTLDTDPQMARLLSSGAQADVDERLRKREKASRDDDDAAKLATKSDAMIYEYEAVCAGSLWYWSVEAMAHSEIERDAFFVMLSAYLANPHLGGKGNRDCGRVSIVEVRGDIGSVEASPRAALTTEGITSPEIARYVAHLSERRDRVVDLLARVVA